MMMRATRIRIANATIGAWAASTRTMTRNGAGQLVPSVFMSTRERIPAPVP